MFADSFSVLSIHSVARGLRASFLYKYPDRAIVPCDSTAFSLHSSRQNVPIPYNGPPLPHLKIALSHLIRI